MRLSVLNSSLKVDENERDAVSFLFSILYFLFEVLCAMFVFETVLDNFPLG